MAQIPADISLSAPQARVLGCLIEKQATTPDSYPMTLKALTTACNQTSSRFPVVQYETTLVEATLHALKALGLIRIVHPAHGERATKYRHVVDEALGLDAGQRSVVALLLLRGPQTVAELKSRSERLFEFETTGQVEAVLEELASINPPAVSKVERLPGQKETRWIQVLEGDAESRASSVPNPEVPARAGSSSSLIQQLTERIESLENRVERLIVALGDLVDMDDT